MKFECPQCGKKYSLPDEKVPQGKDFKVKCKKCGEVIILHGGAGEGADAAAQDMGAPQAAGGSPFGQPPEQERAFEEEPTRVFDYAKPDGQPGYPDLGLPDPMAGVAGMGGMEAPPEQEPEPGMQAGGYGEEPEWHIAVDGEQMGPYLGEQIISMFQAQQIDAETFLWKDGFDEWLPLRDVPEFAGLEQQAPPPAAQAPAAMQGAVKGSLFSEAFGASHSAAKADARARAHDLFSPQAADDVDGSPFEGGGAQDVITSSPGIPNAPRVDASQLTGARHDDSVLFSLTSLQALASSSKEPARAISSTASSEGGSGLIDIRSLAGGVSPTGASSAAKSEDIFSMGGGGFGQPMGIPSLLQPQEKKSNTLLYVLGGVGGFALLAVVVLLVGVFGLGWGRSEPEETTTKPVLDEEALKAKLLAELQKTHGANLSGTQDGGQAAASQGTQEGSGEEQSGEEETNPDGTKKKKKGGAKKGGSEETGGEESTSSGPSESDKPSKAADDLLSLIDKATSKKGSSEKKATVKEDKEPAPAASSLPSTPSKNDVLSAMKKVTSKVKACAGGKTGKAVTSIVFSGSTGKVKSAKVIGGDFAGTPAASCIAKAAQGASVPKFKQSTFSVTYPFVVK
jgi:predicted Zn finger-like uncharacterized protein